MKKKLINFGLITLSLLFIIGCSDDDSVNDLNNGVTAEEGEFAASINGESFSSSSSSQVAATFFAETFNLTVNNSATNETFTITVTDAGEGTFNLGGIEEENGAAYTLNGEDAFVSNAEGGSGQITITNLDLENKKVSGSFNFIGAREILEGEEIITETIEVTGGSFNNLDLATSVTGGDDDILTAKVDGQDLNADSVTAIELSLGGNSNLTITAINNSTNQNLALTFPSDITVGTYDFTGFGSYIGFYNPDLGGDTNQYSANSGTLTINSFDQATNTVEGTFNFSANRLDPNDPDVTYEVTEGSFSVTF
jgi:hypothetical protein